MTRNVLICRDLFLMKRNLCAQVPEGFLSGTNSFAWERINSVDKKLVCSIPGANSDGRRF